MSKKQVSRRDFLKIGAIGAGAAAAMGLAGCGGGAPSSESTTTDDSTSTDSTTTEADTGTGNMSTGTDVGGFVKSSEAVISLDEGMPRWSFMIPPDKVDESAITETKTNDIIVVGGGMSGLTTAVAAAEKGGKVTLFSASSAPISRGGSNFARNSTVMESLGIKPFDPQPFFYNEMRAASFAVDQQKWIRGYNNSEEAMNWMIKLANENGLDVILERDNNFDHGPYYAHAFSTEGDSTMVSTGQQGAVEALAKKAEELGVEVIWDMKAEYLEREGDKSGRVTGVIACPTNDDSKHTRFEANKAVVLATGDFSRNKEMLACYCPEALQFIGYAQEEIDYNTSFTMGGIYGGDGQKMGLWAGAAWQYANIAPMWQGAWGGSHEPLCFHMGLNVNTRTERYQREDISAPYSAHHLLSQPDNIAWGIWTADYAQAIIDRGMEWYSFGMDYTLPPYTAEEMVKIWDDGVSTNSYYKADTLADLAQQINLDADKLQEVVDRYNELCAAGVDTDFYKRPEYLIPINSEGPFYAAQNNVTFMTVMGGLRTDYNMRVCDDNDDPIPGLFNVGCMIGDMYANEYNFAIPGNSYGINCLTFGYLLGHDLADGKFDA